MVGPERSATCLGWQAGSQLVYILSAHVGVFHQHVIRGLIVGDPACVT